MVRHNLLHIFFGLGKEVEDTNDASLKRDRSITPLIQDILKNERQGREDSAPRKYSTKVVLRCRTLYRLARLSKRMEPETTNLELKDIPDAINSYQDQVSSIVVILVQEFDKNIKSSSTDKHLQGQCRCLKYLPHKKSSFVAYLICVLSSCEFGNHRDPSDEAQVFHYLNVIGNDLNQEVLILALLSSIY